MRILLSENKSLKQKILTGSLALFLSFCVALSGISFAYADEFDDQAAQNGKNFTPVPDNEKTSFLLFGSGASGGDGMQGRWEMLTKDEMMSISDNTTARDVFNAGTLAIWKKGQNFSTTSDGKNLSFDLGIAGINVKNLATNYGIKNGGNNDKSRLLIVDQDGISVSSRDYALEYPRYYFSDMSAQGTEITPLLKVQNGVFSLRTGQDKATEVTSDLWKDDIKTLQIDTITTATAKPDVVLSVIDGKTTIDYTLSDVVYSGQYDAVFAYRDEVNNQITTNVRGATLKGVLAAKSIKPLASGDTLYGLDANGASVKLTSPVSQYFLAYEGTEFRTDTTETALTSNSEFVLLGPGTTEDQVKIPDIYTIKINRAPAPTPVVKKPPVTKITKLTKPTKRSIRIRWAKRTGIKGYQIRMKRAGGKYKIIKTIKNAKTTTFVKKKLKKGKKYYFMVRTYKVVNGKTYYSKWSKARYKKL
ncbi:MAG: hypothetical protein IJF96_04935 [Firmicutes bacterium]|nr:hypothetical protein [Bacillota bacterium]